MATMDSRILLRHVLRAPSLYCTMLTPALRPQSRSFALLSLQPFSPRYISMPRILQPSFWSSMIPRPFKERPESSKSREWNPATPFIVLGLLVGSQAIQILWLKQERGRDLRKAEAKIDILREIIERVQKGENVDVEKVLGTGNKEAEAEWAEVIENITEEELLFGSKRERSAARKAAREQDAYVEPVQEVEKEKTNAEEQDGKVKVETVNGAKFY